MSDNFSSKLIEIANSVNIDLKMEVVRADGDLLSDIKIRVPTSSYMLNYLLGGGVPVGRIIEIFGTFGAAKSTIVEHMMIGFQQYPGLSILLDSESGWCRSRAIAMGHNPDRHLAFECDTVELGVKVCQKTIEKIRGSEKLPEEMPIGIFWDTITASETEGEKAGDLYRDGMADKPRKMKAAMRKFSFLLPRANCAMVFVCQTMADLKAQFQNAKVSSSGGDAIKFWASKRLKVWQSGKMKWPTENCGIIATVETVKDKLDPPFKRVEIPVMFETGVHNGYELLLYLCTSKHSKARLDGSKVHITDYPQQGQALRFYMKNLPSVLEQNPELIPYMKSLCDEVWYGLI